MRKIGLTLGFHLLGSVMLSAQVAAPAPDPASPPQSARQALVEMFTGKGESDFAKHLPEAARQSLIHKGETAETSTVLKIATLGRQMTSQGESMKTFDVGPNILVTEQNSGIDRVEVAVEHDSLIGEDDEIELSVHVYKNGQPESLPIIPQLIFTLRQEKEIWRLTEVTVAAHVPLTDPDYLRGLRKEQDETNEAAAQNRARTIALAETGYAAKHPESGYTCTLSSLFAATPTLEGERDRNYYDPGQGNEESSGYRFVLTGCDGSPVTKYRLTATPVDSESTGKTFCADETGAVKSTTGKTGNCFTHGQSVNAAVQAGFPPRVD